MPRSLQNERQSLSVGKEDEKGRGVVDPGHVGNRSDDRVAKGKIVDDKNVALLKIALRRRREGAGAQEPQESGFDAARKELPMRSIGGDFFKRGKSGERGIDRNVSANRSASARSMELAMASFDMRSVFRWFEERLSSRAERSTAAQAAVVERESRDPSLSACGKMGPGSPSPPPPFPPPRAGGRKDGVSGVRDDSLRSLL